MKRATFITIYGVNNIGKTTQAMKLVEHLNSCGYHAEHIKYPVYDSPTGRRINAILRSGKKQEIPERELQKLYIRNREEFEPTLQEKLESGIIIVAEDYIGTGIAWGVAKGLDYKWSKQANAHLLKEDLAILMDGDRFLDSREAVHLHEQDDDIVGRVRRQLLTQAKDFGYILVDANRPVDAVFSDIRAHVHRHI